MHILSHWYFNCGFKFQKSFCNGYHDLLMTSPDINNIAIITGKVVDYPYTIYSISKSDTIHLLENSVLDDH